MARDLVTKEIKAHTRRLWIALCAYAILQAVFISGTAYAILWSQQREIAELKAAIGLTENLEAINRGIQRLLELTEEKD